MTNKSTEHKTGGRKHKHKDKEKKETFYVITPYDTYISWQFSLQNYGDSLVLSLARML